MNNPNTDKAKILIVDDIEINKIILREILADTYEIEQASDGLEAITKMFNAAKKPHLVLLDIMMPDMDGFEVLTLMKSDITLNKIPVIFIPIPFATLKAQNVMKMLAWSDFFVL